MAETLSVGNVDESSPTITSGRPPSFALFPYTTLFRSQATATDSGDVSSGVTFSLSGADAALFTIDGSTGEVRLTGYPDFEAKAAYSFTGVASDGATTPTTKAVTLSVGNVDESSPTITSGATASVVENTAAGQVLCLFPSTALCRSSSGVTFSLSGADAALFTIDGSTGEVRLTGN